MQLTLDQNAITRARTLAGIATGEVQQFIDQHTTTSIERATLRLLGVEGIATPGEVERMHSGKDAQTAIGGDDAPPDVPLVNAVVDALQKSHVLAEGAAVWLAAVNRQYGHSVQEAAHALASGRLNPDGVNMSDTDAVRKTARELARPALERIEQARRQREQWIVQWGERPAPWLYVIVATGNIHDDALQAQAAARQGADVIAIIRSTAQSLLDYVPEGATTQGFGGTYATQENMRIVRAALDEVGMELGRYIRLTNYASGLCMPEIAALGALERLDMMLSDSMYGILFRDINPRRTFVDQHFSRRLQALAGQIINTGEDNYLTTDNAFDAAHTVLASQFLNESFAHRSGLPDRQIGLGHAFEMDPCMDNQLLWQIADAMLSRVCFPNAPLKYMPPTKHISGDIFMAHLMNALFNLTSIVTGQNIHLVGILTEGVHTPWMSDRQLAIANARYLFTAARDFSTAFEFKADGLIEQRAGRVLQQAVESLEKIAEQGLWKVIGEGGFAGVRRAADGGRGGDGVVPKATQYYNPFDEFLPCDWKATPTEVTE